MLRMFSDEQILDLDFRKAVIEEIGGYENQTRRAMHKRRYDLYKDKTKKWVYDSMVSDGLAVATINGILSRTPAINICSKIINKLARTYNSGVKREAGSATEQTEKLAGLLSFDKNMRQADRYRELHKNCMIQIVPRIDNADPVDPIYCLSMRAWAPFEYDVIEDCYNKEMARCVILSDFADNPDYRGAPSTDDLAARHTRSSPTASDGIDNIIADSDSPTIKTFIWWTKTYTFTTDEKGKILQKYSPPDNLNPINELPFVNNAEGQDGRFWAEGGEDIPESHIIINKTIGDMQYIAYLQGFGQYVVTGRNVNEKIVLGPNNAITINYDKDDPEPKVSVVSANPPLDSWMRMIEQHIALLLTTNNLSAGNVAGTLSANNFPSGVAMLIEQSEATTGVEDKQQDYAQIEKAVWYLVALWQNYLLGTGQLEDEFAEIGQLPEDYEVNIRFNENKAIITEDQKLAAMKLRKELGLVEQVDLLMADNPGMTREQAEEKAAAIALEKSNNFGGNNDQVPFGNGADDQQPVDGADDNRAR